MNTINSRYMNPVQAILNALGLTLMACGTAMAGAVLHIQGPGDNGGQFNGVGQVIDCGGALDSVGIFLDKVSNAHVIGYEVKNCEVGVLIYKGNNNHLNNLYIHHSLEDGIRLEGGTTNNHINNNKASYNGGWGINLKSGSNGNKFESMTVKANGLGGYRCDNSDRNVINSNRLIENQFYGVLLESDCDYNTVRSTFITNTIGIGINIDGDKNTIQADKITGSTSEGIKLESDARKNLVQANQVNQNDAQGIENAGDENTFKSNTVNENGKQGILMKETANLNFIKSNTAVDNGGNDLEDKNPGCGNNTWETNNFGTADPACID